LAGVIALGLRRYAHQVCDRVRAGG